MTELKRFEYNNNSDTVLILSIIENDEGLLRTIIGPRIDKNTGIIKSVGELTLLEYYWLAGRIDDIRIFALGYYRERRV